MTKRLSISYIKTLKNSKTQIKSLNKLSKLYLQKAIQSHQHIIKNFYYVKFLDSNLINVPLHSLASNGPNKLEFNPNGTIDLVMCKGHCLHSILTYYSNLKTVQFHYQFMQYCYQINCFSHPTTSNAVLGLLNIFPIKADIPKCNKIWPYTYAEYATASDCKYWIENMDFYIPIMHVLHIGPLWDKIYNTNKLSLNQKYGAIILILIDDSNPNCPIKSFTSDKSAHTKGYHYLIKTISHSRDPYFNIKHNQKELRFIHNAIQNLY